jgi:tetratricopeptide (TPR) repeat protein
VHLSKAIELDASYARVWCDRGQAYSALSQWDKAFADFSKAIDRGDPNVVMGQLVRCVQLAEQDGKLSQSEREAAVQRCISFAAKVAGECGKRFSNDADTQARMSWFLSICPDARFRNPRLGLQLAQRAAQLSERLREGSIELGIAHYRAGNWKAALEELQKAMVLRGGGDCADWFFLALTHWQLGHQAEARQWYDKAYKWMANHHDDDWPHFRAEAAALLGIQLQSNKENADVKPPGS